MTWRQGRRLCAARPSGCGKTTLLNVISGIITPSRRKILFDGKDITPLSTQKRNIAQVFQFPVIYDTMTVGENLAFPLKNRGVPKAAIDKRVTQIARLLDLEPYVNRKATRLTADAKQKISLGRGLVRSDVAAVLFDEPLTVIDPELKWQLRSKLKALHRELDLTMIYVTHDQTEALTFADTVVVMHDGRVVQSGTPAELFDKPAHTFVGYFIGSPGMNILPAEVRAARLGSTVTSSRSTALTTICPPAPRSRSACARNSSMWSRRRPACSRQRSTGSTISAASASHACASAMPSSRRARRQASPAPTAPPG
jgi:glycerol transport system ATP-binding protein